MNETCKSCYPRSSPCASINASSNVLQILAAGQSQTGSLSTNISLDILFGILGPLVAILIAVWTARNGSCREESAQGMFVPASWLANMRLTLLAKVRLMSLPEGLIKIEPKLFAWILWVRRCGQAFRNEIGLEHRQVSLFISCYINYI